MIFATPNHEHESECNCTIETVNNGVRENISRLLEGGKKVIYLHLLFTNQINPFLDSYRGDTYSPMNWVRIAGRHGRSLLFLRPEFEQLSLKTLSLETGYIEVSLVQKPENCLLHFNTTHVEDTLRDLLLSDFKPRKDGGSLSEHEFICNMHIRNDNSYAQFFYRCCHKRPDGKIVCQDLIYDYWIYVVFICVIIINVVAIMFTPFLIPDSFYREKYGNIKYEHELREKLKIRVTKISKTEIKFDSPSTIVLPIKQIRSMTSFHQFIEGLYVNKEHTYTLDKVVISVPYQRLIPANYVPVGIMKTFYTMFVNCDLRKSPTFFECCRGSIFGKLSELNNTDEKNKYCQTLLGSLS
ncbi:unnamed protein product [Mytilus edulis]|uniref:Uncharacterized protein n=1 Tax=Mytilus edulis TaxID=6550 RepID=A0A8S3SA89_MYTED|nr:unnamed protein product [Mytilus edulis]